MSYQEFRPRQFQQVPIVVKNIIIINIILFAIKSFIPHIINLDLHLDLQPINSSWFKPHQFVTYMFMHYDISHIFFNMLGVYMFGSVLENDWGPKRFLNFYLICGLGAAALQLIIYYFSNQYSVLLGASGALLGLLGAFAMMFPNMELQLYFIIPVKAKYLAIGYGILELFNGFYSNDNIAHFAHVGGLIVGVTIMLIWKRNNTFFH